MKVNGRSVTDEVEPNTLMVDFIRISQRLTGTHVGCDTSQCGACVVHVNGRSVNNLTQAIAAYWSLRKSETVEVEISRKGTRRTLTYTLVG